MAVEISISSTLLARIIAHAASDAREVCGLLYGDVGRIEGVEACGNVATDPERRFEIDPSALIAAHRATRAGGARVIGHYHSHPAGEATPSARDAADAVADGALWLIVASGKARVWCAVERGAVEGRFEPVTMAVDG